jgi:hypothetical protein
MLVDLNEAELFALITTWHEQFLAKRNAGVDATFEEVTELKLVEALLKETGHIQPTDKDAVQPTGRAAYLRFIEDRAKEERGG